MKLVSAKGSMGITVLPTIASHIARKQSCQVPKSKQLVIAFDSEVFASCEDASPDSRYGVAGVAQVGAVESEYTRPSMST